MEDSFFEHLPRAKPCARPSQSYCSPHNHHSHCTDGKLGVQRDSGTPARSQSWTVLCRASDVLSPCGIVTAPGAGAPVITSVFTMRKHKLGHGPSRGTLRSAEAGIRIQAPEKERPPLHLAAPRE